MYLLPVLLLLNSLHSRESSACRKDAASMLSPENDGTSEASSSHELLHYYIPEPRPDVLGGLVLTYPIRSNTSPPSRV